MRVVVVPRMVQPFLSPHAANRHYASCRGAGAGRLGGAVTTTCLAARLCFSVAEQTDRTYAEQQESTWFGNILVVTGPAYPDARNVGPLPNARRLPPDYSLCKLRTGQEQNRV